MPPPTSTSRAEVAGGLEWSELTAPTSRHDVREFARHVRRTDRTAVVSLRKRIASALALVVTAAIAAALAWFVVFLGEIATTPGTLGTGSDPAVSSGPNIGGLAATVAVGLFVAVLLRWMWQAARRDTRLSNHWRRRLRLARFAEANGGEYLPEMADPALPGTVFQLGTWRRASGVLDLRRSRGLMIGDLTATGKDLLGTRRWTFAIVRLEARLPHLVLEARRPGRNLSRRIFGWTYAGRQRLSLEGDFDRHFTLSVPAGYGADALYVMTPDLMALLIDRAHGFDVEIVDDALILSRPGTVRIDDVEALSGITTVVDALREKAERQTRRYSDTRPGAVPHVVVAPAGRRLVRTRTLAVAIGVILLVLRLANLIHQFAH